MFKRTKVNTGVLLAISGLSLAISTPGLAQEAQRIEITGSAIKRILAEGALPVQVLREEDIQRTGATSVTDLLQRLPAMQGGLQESAGTGGDTFGFSGASIHNIGDTRTLVLLNGHRLALFGGQTINGGFAGIDLNSIPISAIERIEILTDGASALYGSDAIAGVVNFITRRNTDAGDISIGYSSPSGGAKEKRISATKGFGSIDADGYNALLTLSHDERTKLNATDRSFAKTGEIFFSRDGKSYRATSGSDFSIPATVVDENFIYRNPALEATGNCPDRTFFYVDPNFGDEYCQYDFARDLEIYPVRKRDSALLSLNKRFGDHEVFADILYSKTQTITRKAPAAGFIDIPDPSAFPSLTPTGITFDPAGTFALYRFADLGKRVVDDRSKFLDIAVGAKGFAGGWDYSTTLTHSTSKVQSFQDGPGVLAVQRLLDATPTPLLDPFVGPGLQSPAAIDAISWKGYWDGGESKLDSFQLRGWRELMELAGGTMALATGVSYGKETIQSKPGLFAQSKLADPVTGTPCPDPLDCDLRFGESGPYVPYSADRRTYGLFGELAMPLTKALEVTTSLRFDHYSDFGNASTAKASFRFTPRKDLLIRGSIGTGFRAPTVPQVKASPQSFGVTAGDYPCTPELEAQAMAQGAICNPSDIYDVLAGGNPNLQPEKSRQASIGLRFEPTPTFSAGVDLWYVTIRDAFGQLPEKQVFDNPAAFPGSWGSRFDPVTGDTYLAFKDVNVNLGKAFYTGLDFDIVGRARTGWGNLTSQLALTYMLREALQTEKNGPYFSAIGNFADLGVVTFRWKGKWTNSLQVGDWTHTLAVNGQSGYKDLSTTVDVLDASGNVVGDFEDVRLDVKAYFTADWQTTWAVNKNSLLTVGVLNIADTKPPLSISRDGLSRGSQFGYDDRYYDPRGRTFYVSGSFRF